MQQLPPPPASVPWPGTHQPQPPASHVRRAALPELHITHAYGTQCVHKTHAARTYKYGTLSTVPRQQLAESLRHRDVRLQGIDICHTSGSGCSIHQSATCCCTTASQMHTSLSTTASRQLLLVAAAAGSAANSNSNRGCPPDAPRQTSMAVRVFPTHGATAIPRAAVAVHGRRDQRLPHAPWP